MINSGHKVTVSALFVFCGAVISSQSLSKKKYFPYAPQLCNCTFDSYNSAVINKSVFIFETEKKSPLFIFLHSWRMLSNKIFFAISLTLYRSPTWFFIYIEFRNVYWLTSSVVPTTFVALTEYVNYLHFVQKTGRENCILVQFRLSGRKYYKCNALN